MQNNFGNWFTRERENQSEAYQAVTRLVKNDKGSSKRSQELVDADSHLVDLNGLSEAEQDFLEGLELEDLV